MLHGRKTLIVHEEGEEDEDDELSENSDDDQPENRIDKHLDILNEKISETGDNISNE